MSLPVVAIDAGGHDAEKDQRFGKSEKGVIWHTDAAIVQLSVSRAVSRGSFDGNAGR